MAPDLKITQRPDRVTVQKAKRNRAYSASTDAPSTRHPIVESESDPSRSRPDRTTRLKFSTTRHTTTKVRKSEPHLGGGDEPPGHHAPCVRGGGDVKRCSHLLNESPKTYFQPPTAVDASVMLREHGEATCNHSDRLLATSTSPPRSARRQTVTLAGRFF